MEDKIKDKEHDLFKEFREFPKLRQNRDINTIKAFIEFFIFCNKKKFTLEEMLDLMRIIAKIDIEFENMILAIAGYEDLKSVIISQALILKKFIEIYEGKKI